MKALAVPVSMLASRGAGVSIAASVLGLLVFWALMNRRDPTAPNQAANR